MIAAPALTQNAAAQHHTGAVSHVFVDERFSGAVVIARRIAPFQKLTPVNGDISLRWLEDHALVSPTRPLSLRGVTTESFYFCVKTLLQSRGLAHAHIERATNDLHLWEIETSITQQDGMA